MVENRLEKDIIGLYSSNLVNLYSINQIASKLGKRYPYINKKVTELLDERILKKTVIGKSYLCSLNLDNPRTIMLLSLQHLQKKKKLSLDKIEHFLDKTRLSITIHCIISYNNNLLFVIENIHDRRTIQREFKDSQVVDKKEFLDMISDNKELFTDHTVLYGFERFYELLKIELDELKILHSPLRY